ncbi:MAG: deoxyribonuclease IV [Halanaerobiales bacterium]
MKLGKHVSISGGIDKAPSRAKDLGCNCFQIFAKNPRSWKGRSIDNTEIKKLRGNMKDLQMNDLVVHTTYLINLASPKDELWEKSIAGLKDDYNRCGKIGAEYLILHPGSHIGSGIESGIQRISEALNNIFSEVQNRTMILLENVSGTGTAIGSNFAQIHDIIKRIKDKERVGLCLDTCHAFAAGYDLRNEEGLNRTLNEIEQELSIEKLRVIHINDSKYDLDSNKDEHAHIGEGYIGDDAFRKIINHSLLKNLTFILETPDFSGEDEDVRKILSLRDE